MQNNSVFMPTSSAEGLITSFSQYVRNLEAEVASLRRISTLQAALESGTSMELMENMADLESIVSRLESSVTHLNESLDSELAATAETKKIIEAAKEQAQQIESIESVISTTIQKDSDNNNNNNAPIVEAEFLQVSKTIRNRITCAQVNEAWAFLVKYITEKSKVLNRARSQMPRSAQLVLDKYKEFKTFDHGDQMFVLENELRNTIIFQFGDSTGKSILQTLRSLHKIKLIRSMNENTYILI